MAETPRLTLPKEERLCSRKLADELFSGAKSRSMAAYPLRVVWMTVPRADGQQPVQILVSVPKRHFKRAVKRNRVKRQVREAWRHQRQPLLDRLEATPDRAVVLAFIWLADELYPSSEVNTRVQNLVWRLAEKIGSA